MSTVAEKLNEILADEWACVRVLRRSESQCDDPDKREVIKRIRKDCSVNCVSLANVIRALDGSPTDIPSPRFSLKLSDESLTDTLDMFQSTQQHILDEIAAVMDDPDLKSARSSLALVQQLYRENIRWLANAFGAGSSRRCNHQADLGLLAPFCLLSHPIGLIHRDQGEEMDTATVSERRSFVGRLEPREMSGFGYGAHHTDSPLNRLDRTPSALRS